MVWSAPKELAIFPEEEQRLKDGLPVSVADRKGLESPSKISELL
uniref:Uncharacterized protein n=1 Tax=Physcomitrium patens TaxID=3218 RepID=A0A2K1KKU8_PHYPA|nr:hypothetical protein PHYPA_008060 [Physcomitrium patens]